MEQEQAQKAHNLLHRIYTQVPAILIVIVVIIAFLGLAINVISGYEVKTTISIMDSAITQFDVLSTKASSSEHMLFSINACIKTNPVKNNIQTFKIFSRDEISEKAKVVVDFCLKNYVESGLTVDDYEKRAVAVKALRPHVIT
jgi:hypothetical protein